MIAVLIFFRADNEKKGIWWKQYQNNTAARQRWDSITASDTIARKPDTQKSKTIKGHWRNRDGRATTVATARKTGTEHWRDRDKRVTMMTTARNRSACYVTSKLATKWKNSYLFGLLTLYLVWWWFTLVTVGRNSLPFLVWYIHSWIKLGCKLNIQILTVEYTILCFEFDLCGLLHRQDRYKRAATVAASSNGSAC